MLLIDSYAKRFSSDSNGALGPIDSRAGILAQDQRLVP